MNEPSDTISVEQRHIDAGTPNECWSCPVALAVREHIGMNSAPCDGILTEFPNDLLQVEVNYYVTVSVRETDIERKWSVPKVRAFEALFDEHVEAKPFTFELIGLTDWLSSVRAADAAVDAAADASTGEQQ